MKAQIGLIGLGTMGQNLARNIANHKFKISVFNRTAEKTKIFIKEFENKYLSGETDLKKFINNLEKPRKIILLVQAGFAVDKTIKHILPFLQKEDIIIDCGNSNFLDTQKRCEKLKKKNINFVGCGISGGEKGALMGPSLMPGGNKKSWEKIKKIFEKIAAKDFNKKPCVTFIGENGAGHFVKTAHNGIEYGVMQIIAETYEILQSLYGLKAPEISKIFERLDKGNLKSYLLEISTKVLNKKDDFKKGYLMDFISDKAEQKGTGIWSSQSALINGAAIPSITEAVFFRTLSGDTKNRIILSKIYKNKKSVNYSKLKEILPHIKSALSSAIIITYSQGFELLKTVSKNEKWKLNLSEIARIWQGGCIIRSDILKLFQKSLKITKEKHILADKEVYKELDNSIKSLREICAVSALTGIPIPALSASLNYFDTVRKSKLPTNLIQGLRDFFGAHTYERTDKKGHFHSTYE
ncbi:NADP-dependent phosphogluconate dehydrogenase [Candidatus Peregrinibacteria bacterium]|nr:NADP-dependent phosphogluconate dehydrogenase [Candidatus Peregrinibacteria bacterium]